MLKARSGEPQGEDAVTHIVLHEIAWLLLGAVAAGHLAVARRRPTIMRFVAAGIDSSADPASQIRLLAGRGQVVLKVGLR